MPADAGSLGGALAANLSGPRRIKAGAARDHFLGFSAVSGRAETFKSGGRVVKNVTGYDLCKLLAGSFGTLAAMTEVTIKTLPAPETEATVLVLGLDDARANAAMSAAMGCSCDVSAAAHLPRNTVMHFAGLYVDKAATAFRLEGFAPSVKHRTGALVALLRTFGPTELIDPANSQEALAQRPRRRAVLGQRLGRRLAAVARLDHARARRRVRRASCRPARSSSTTGRAAWSGPRCRPPPMPARPPSAAPPP